MVTDLQSNTPDLHDPGTLATPAGDHDLLAEFRALTTDCGVSALKNQAKILLTGEDRTRWLNGMVTNNIRDLAPGQGLYTFLLNPQGKIQGDFYAFNRGADIALDIECGQLAKLLAVFDHYIVMDDVVVTDASSPLAAVGVQGPKSRELLQKTGIDVPELRPLQFVETVWQNSAITLVRAESWKGEAYEIWLGTEKVSALVAALAEAGATPVHAETQRLYRIAAGIPFFGEDIRERDLPHETGQERALHYAKGCYVGQEIVERVRTQGRVHRMFSGFEMSKSVAVGSKITAEIPEKGVKEVGEITSIAEVPGQSSRVIALGYLRREAFERPLDINGSSLKLHSLPFEEILQGSIQNRAT